MLHEKRVRQHLRTFGRMLEAYTGTEPLARFLTGFYRQNKQMGSADRRMASRLLYHYFRIGHAASAAPVMERLAMAEYCCSSESAVVALLQPGWVPHITASLEEKIAFLEAHTAFRRSDIFPYRPQLSEGVDAEAFTNSLLEQPDLFIRLRAPFARQVKAALDAAQIPYTVSADHTLALPNGTALDRVSGIAGKYEVQDLSSQRTGAYFRAAAGQQWWDACAGAGGKSLLLLDTTPGVELLVSDVRGSILRNLDERFDAAGITARYGRKIIDLTRDPHAVLGNAAFDGIILDAPCSGSGTWSRTPEQITAFQQDAINTFSALQRQLAGHAIAYLKPGKPFIYITCSVFAAENEATVSFLQQHYGLELEEQTMLTGYHQHADSLFVARLIKKQ